MSAKTKSLIVAFYLPQFHPIPENDAAWGTGFTEWNNVVKAKPKFRGHHQPHLPEDLGFYDLRLDQTRARQAEMASDHGIDAFCYYSYWFDNRPILGLPLQLEMAAATRNFPICLCWANENWTKAWDGREADVILKQDYGMDSLLGYCAYLIEAFLNEKYLRFDGCPVFLVYSPEEIPSDIKFTELLRNQAQKAGLQDVYLIAVKHGRAKSSNNDYLAMGYNEVLLFQPNKIDFPKPSGLRSKVKASLRQLLPRSIFNQFRLRVSSYQSVNYKSMAQKLSEKAISSYEIPCVFPSWDNSARRSISTVVQNNNPEDFGRWLKAETLKVQKKGAGLNAVFINAWNEWAEGCHLEPDQNNSKAFLREIAAAVNDDQRGL